MTRPDASQILPGVTFTDPSALVATAGNPTLKPYTSDNYDLGGEIYTGGIGYVGLSLFQKNVQGFTVTQRSEEHTSELQSLMRISYAVFCLKKKKKHNNTTHTSHSTNSK